MDADYQKRESKAVSAIKKAIPASLKQDIVKGSVGSFAELYENNEILPNHFIACSIDGVGTKVILAEAMGKFDTIGIDCVAMCANDLATLGKVSPFLFMDYLACQSKIQDEAITGPIIKGIVKGLEQCDASSALRNSIRMNFGKGETASVDELISSSKEGYGFDIAGCMLGFAEKAFAGRKRAFDGDKIIALRSSGPHSNGFTDLRRFLLKGDFESREGFRAMYKGKFALDDKFDGSTIGKKLLEPTKIYIQTMAKIARNFDVIGANNTGYGLKNLNRISGFEFRITSPLEPQQIFKLMQQESGFTDEQMYSTFNMGMGFFIIARKEEADDILQAAKDGAVVGEVRAGKSRTILEKGGKRTVFEGY
ncbi:hypothetical protein HYU10_03725 [Candidatus Woesearchaeota archaeon]|nr:hypothetical protein [Candidatus Woesearchaeota archaeon]MBI2130852.1 hypothetical protein [Candidatus Woesearchaeota archaeon]